MTEVIIAVISGVFSVIAVIVTNVASNRKTQNAINTHQAVTDEKISNLTEEVRRHNGVIERTYKLEARVDVLEARLEERE